MRRISRTVTAAALVLSMTLGFGSSPASAAIGFDSAYQFESAFLSLAPGDSGTFAVFFANTGATAWVKGTATQVNLAICAADKILCNTGSPNGTFAVGWLSPTAYATHTKDVVGAGDFSPFSYNIKIPAGQAAGTYRFNGDLVVGATGEKVHPEGYYQDATVTAPAVALAIVPDYDQTEDNEVSATVPGNGQHTYTVTTTFTGTMSFAILPTANISRSSDGSYNFCDNNGDKKADLVGGGATFFTAINGVSVPASAVLPNQSIPADGKMTLTIDSATRNQLVRVVAWQDKNQNSGIDLKSAGTDNSCRTLQPYDSTTDGAMVVSARKFYFGAKGTFGTQFSDICQPVYRHDTVNRVFSAGTTSDTSLRFTYDSNDTFKVNNTQVQQSIFQNSLTAAVDGTGSTIKINYSPDPAGFSEFNICTVAGALAPTNVTAATGNFDNGTSAEDVRISFTAPANNTVTSYSIQRASVTGTATGGSTGNCYSGTATNPSDGSAGTPSGSAFSVVGSVSANAGETGTFTNFDLGNGGYCFRVMVQNPNIGIQSVSNYAPANVPGASDTIAPTSSLAVLTQSSGFSNSLDAGDKLVLDFSEPMSISATAVIRVTDSDCGSWSQNGATQTPGCTGAQTNTVADIICGSNATCVIGDGSFANSRLAITMTGNPTIVAAGSVTGAQFPVNVTDAQGITDLSGNNWNLTGSADRVIP